MSLYGMDMNVDMEININMACCILWYGVVLSWKSSLVANSYLFAFFGHLAVTSFKNKISIKTPSAINATSRHLHIEN